MGEIPIPPWGILHRNMSLVWSSTEISAGDGGNKLTPTNARAPNASIHRCFCICRYCAPQLRERAISVSLSLFVCLRHHIVLLFSAAWMVCSLVLKIMSAIWGWAYTRFFAAGSVRAVEQRLLAAVTERRLAERRESELKELLANLTGQNPRSALASLSY